MEKSFRDRGIRCDSLLLSPRLPLAAVIRRQILEGVQAVIRLTRQAQFSGKIPLQVFNRSAGVDNVQFDGKVFLLVPASEYKLTLPVEYDDLETHIAAELVVRAKQTHSAPQTAQYNAPQQAYGVPQYAQPIPQTMQHPVSQQQPPPAAAPNLANLITSLDGPTLQKLLGAMGQSPQTPQQHVPQLQQPVSADLASLLSGAGRQQPQQPSYQQQQQQQQMPLQGANPYAALAANPAFANNPGLATLLGGAAGRPQQAMMPQQQQPQSGQQVQSIMDQLAKWRQ